MHFFKLPFSNRVCLKLDLFLFCRELGETVDNDELAIAVENVFQFEAALAVVSKNCSKIVFSCQKSILIFSLLPTFVGLVM